jgi:hypothetical protein
VTWTAAAAAKRVDDLYTTRAAAWTAASGALANVTAWLGDGMPGNTMLEAVEIEGPKLAKNEGILDGVERLRRRGRELKADLHRIRSSPFPASHVKARMREEIERLARRGAVDVSGAVEHDASIQFPMMRMRSMVVGAQETLAFGEVADAVALFAWLNRDALIARLDCEIDAEADDAAALSHEARQKAEAEVLGDLLNIERQETELVWLAMAQNLPCEHRADCAPQAILGVRLISQPPHGNGAVESSPAMSWPIGIGNRAAG